MSATGQERRAASPDEVIAWAGSDGPADAYSCKSRFTHRVERVRDGADCGEHTSFALAQKRLNRLVAMSNGRQAAADFRIVEVKP